MRKGLLCCILGISLCFLGGCGNENTQVINGTQKDQQNVVSVEKEENDQSDIVFLYDELENGTLSIWSYTGGEKVASITIPSEISGKEVSEVTGALFRNNDKVKQVVWPETVTEIDKEMFYFSSNMEELVMNGAIETIGEDAIYGCSSLKTLTFKDGLKTIEKNGIGQCEKLTDVYLPSTVESVDVNNFMLCAKPIKIHVPAGSTTESVIKDLAENNAADIEVVSE